MLYVGFFSAILSLFKTVCNIKDSHILLNPFSYNLLNKSNFMKYNCMNMSNVASIIRNFKEVSVEVKENR